MNFTVNGHFRFGFLAKGAVVLGATLIIAACQTSGKSASSAPQTPGQAQAIYYDCLQTASHTPVLSAGGSHISATRFLNRCAGELNDWEDALVANGTPPDQASEFTDDVMNRIREDITGRFRPIN